MRCGTGGLDRIDDDADVEIDDGDLATAMRVNLEAPMALSCAFLRATQDWTAARKVLNISSGLARHAMASQAPWTNSPAASPWTKRAARMARRSVRWRQA